MPTITIAPQFQQPQFSSLEQFKDKIQQEFCSGSGIAIDVFKDCVRLVSDTETNYGGEADYPIHSALNWKVTRFGHQTRTTQFAALLCNEDGLVWQAKLAHPNWDRQKGRYRKYEAPIGNGSRAFLPTVNSRLRQLIAQRYHCTVPEQGSFWEWLEQHPEIPIIVTEGAKKALCLLSNGWIAISLYGIYSGYSSKDEYGNPTFRKLIADLARFAVPERSIVLAFDQDHKQSTRSKVAQAQQRFGELLNRQGCYVQIALWQHQLGKGVDDLWVNQGASVWETVYHAAIPYHAYSQVAKLTYQPDLILQQPYLGSLLTVLPAHARLVCLQSPKGTGKTESIAEIVTHAIQGGQRVLILTHRVQLGQALSDRFGVPYVTELRTAETGEMLGYGLCVDSLHPGSQAKFDAKHWKDALVVIDEAEQVIWHLLNAATEVKQHRVQILQQFQQLMSQCLRPDGDGQVILSDADLSDTAINFVKHMAQQPELNPWILVNQHKPAQPWTIYTYNQSSPQKWLHALIYAINDGHRPLIQVSGQRPGTRWGTRALERLLVKLFPHLKILRVDSETVSDPTHAAYGSISKLNEVLSQYDIVLASPSIETGVSIDLKGHFTSVWGAFQGIAPADSVRQTLSRLREPVERHIWIANVGALGLIGNGSTNTYQLLKSVRQPIQGTLRVLQAIDHSLEQEFAGATQEHFIALRTWAALATRINAGLLRYRETLFSGLRLEGHHLIEVNIASETHLKNIRHFHNLLKEIEHFYNLLKEEANADAIAEAKAVVQAEEISHHEAEKLVGQKAKSQLERQKLRKHQLKQKYCVEVDVDLVLKDDQRWFPQIRLHYYLTTGRDLLTDREVQVIRTAIANGNGRVWHPDLKGSLLLHQVIVLEKLGLPKLLRQGLEGRLFTAKDKDLLAIAQVFKADPQGTKNLLGITVSAKATSIKVFSQILHKLGLRIQQVCRKGGSNGKGQVRHWRLSLPNDRREQIFAAWLERDQSVVTHSALKRRSDPSVTTAFNTPSPPIYLSPDQWHSQWHSWSLEDIEAG